MPERRLPRVEPVYQRLRAWLGGQQILDSRKAYLFEDGHHPLWAVPRRDLHATLEPHGSADATGTRRWTVATDSVRRHGAARQAAGRSVTSIPIKSSCSVRTRPTCGSL